MNFDIVLERQTRNKLNPENARKTLRTIVKAAERNKDMGISAGLSKLGEPSELFDEAGAAIGWQYSVKARLKEDKARTKEVGMRRLEHAFEMVTRRAASRDWVVRKASEATVLPAQAFLAGEPQAIPAPSTVVRTPFVVPALNDEVMKGFFNGVYEREAHIRLIHDSVTRFRESNGRIRGHTLLHGLPAGCKTTMFERFKEWYESDGGDFERVRFLDGPTLSKAGLENWLLRQAADRTLPEILVIEEVEKQPLDNMLTLLSVMGSGYVAKHNARVQDRQECKCLVWATCNDPELLRVFRNGALWSRFSHRWHCSRPTKDLMSKILSREVEAIGGRQEWVAKVMEFAYDKLKLEDPREIIALLDGGDRLLDNSYQRDVLSILSAQQQETSN